MSVSVPTTPRKGVAGKPLTGRAEADDGGGSGPQRAHLIFRCATNERPAVGGCCRVDGGVARLPLDIKASDRSPSVKAVGRVARGGQPDNSLGAVKNESKVAGVAPSPWAHREHE